MNHLKNEEKFFSCPIRRSSDLKYAVFSLGRWNLWPPPFVGVFQMGKRNEDVSRTVQITRGSFFSACFREREKKWWSRTMGLLFPPTNTRKKEWIKILQFNLHWSCGRWRTSFNAISYVCVLVNVRNLSLKLPSSAASRKHFLDEFYKFSCCCVVRKQLLFSGREQQTSVLSLRAIKCNETELEKRAAKRWRFDPN